MSAIKAHLFPLSCGVVVVLAVGAVVWPIGYWPIGDRGMMPDLQERMEKQLASARHADDLMKMPVKLYTADNVKGPIVQAIIDAKRGEQEGMKRQAEHIAKLAAVANREKRVTQGPHGVLIPLLGLEPEEHYLPKFEGAVNPQEFMDHYRDLLDTTWLKQLGAGMPPTAAEADDAVKKKQEQMAAAAPRGLAGQPLTPGAGQMSPAQIAKYKRALVANRAQSVQIFADATVFQRREWALGATPPNEEQIFDAFIDCCVMQDLVNAVLATNQGATNVEGAHIKRLGQMAIGANAAGTPVGPTGVVSLTPIKSAGDLFLATGAGAAAAPTGPSFGGTARSTVDLTRSMTGRIGGENYDVTHVRLLVYLDPSYLNQFIQEIYRQGKSYTVLNVRIEASDPFDAAAEGFLYGPTPVIKADLLLEAVFYRDWTKGLMPETIRASLGILPDTK